MKLKDHNETGQPFVETGPVEIRLAFVTPFIEKILKAFKSGSKDNAVSPDYSPTCNLRRKKDDNEEVDEQSKAW